jgi:DNA mismatch repair ATPase MutS
MASPVITLLLPIIMLIIPFFIIQLKGLHLTVEEYMQVLKIILSQHVLGKFFNDFNEVSLNQKFYLLVSAGFYLFSIYQNILVCIRFHQNMKKIHDYFKEINAYLNYTIDSMDHYLSCSKNLKTHQEFNSVLEEKKEALKDLKNKLSFVSEYKFSITKVLEIGTILKYFYEIYDNSYLEAGFLYSFGFHGYIDCIEGIKENLESKQLNFIKFSKKKTVLKKNYYAPLKDAKPIKNTVNLTKNIIITGPNASGKTTVLKSALINILLSQQFGCGFYRAGSTLKPFDYIHCYLNIPDTSGRDSLFQAEARRCKEIIDFIHHHDKKESHFCVFDELYSGTNPEEAESSAISFMNYLVKKRNVATILTTHYMKVCKELEANDTIVNYHMKVNFHDKNDFQYMYLLSEGISQIKGGIKVLKDMNYPKEILETISQSFVNSKN